MSNYVELNRRFIEIDSGQKDLENIRELVSYGGDYWGTLDWDDIWASKAVVVLAEAGAGKTTELREQARKLRNGGKAAFFIPLEELASEGLDASLEFGTEESFSAWELSQETGYFLLDSVDETRLVHKSFENALKSFARRIRPALTRVKLVITCRFSDWRWNVDRQAVMDILPSSSQNKAVQDMPEPTNAGLLNPFFADDDDNEDESSDVATAENRKPYRLVAMAALRSQEWRIFAEARGVPEADSFVAAIERSNAQDSASRPLDLEGLIGYWKAHGELGTLSERLNHDVERRLIETNPMYQATHDLSLERASYGTEVLSAAVTLCNVRSIRLPAAKLSRQVRQDAIDANVVLDNWGDAEIGALLHRSIFHGSSYGCVSIHHRNMQSYFAARFLRDLNKSCLADHRLFTLLFCRFGDVTELRPSVAPIAGWLSLWEPKVFKWMVEYSPETLMTSGDPESLTDEQVEQILTSFCEKFSERTDTGLRLYQEDAKRLARPGTSAKIRQLWDQYCDLEDHCNLLLRLIEHGPIEDCADVAFHAIAADQLSVQSSEYAIKAIAHAGSDKLKRMLVEMLLPKASALDTRISGCLVRHFVSGFITIDELHQIAIRAPAPDNQIWLNDLRRVLIDVIDDLEQESVLFLLRSWLPLLAQTSNLRKGYVKPELSDQHGWLLTPVATLAAKLLDENEIPDPAVAESVELVNHCKEWHIGAGHYDLPDLAARVSSSETLNEFFFWRSVRRESKNIGKPIANWWQAREYGCSWRLGEKDIDWLLQALIVDSIHEEKLVALTAIFDLRSYWESTEEYEHKVRDAVQKAKLKQELDSYFDKAAKPTKLSRSDEKLRRKHMAQRAADMQSWIDFRDRHAKDPSLLSDQTRAGTDEGFWDRYNFVKWLKKKEPQSRSWGALSWEPLFEGFPESIVIAARDAIIAYWPTYTPPLESEKENPGQHFYYLDVGLSGLNFLAQLEPEWPAKLDESEAETAVRYALDEQSHFPFWASALFEAQGAIANAIVRTQIDWDFAAAESKTNRFSVLDKFRYGDLSVTERFMTPLLDRLEKGDPASFRGLDTCIDRLMHSTKTIVDRLDALAHKRTPSDLDFEELPKSRLWISVLLARSPEEGLRILRKWLAKAGKRSDEVFVSVISALYDHDGTRYPRNRMACLAHPFLAELTLLAFQHVPADGDRVPGRTYSPNQRDSAERARNHLLEVVMATQGQDSINALVALANEAPTIARKDRMLTLADRRRALNCDSQRLEASDFLALKRIGELIPKNSHDFSRLVVDKTKDIREYLEGGDDQQKRLVREERDESLVQLKLKTEYDRIANGLYHTHRETEVAEKKSPDILVSSTSSSAEIAVEVKVGDNNYTARDLANGIVDQLIGKYLRNPSHRSHGVFVVTYHGQKKYWLHPEERTRMTFRTLIEYLKSVAREANIESQWRIEVNVVGIDLTDTS